MKKLYFNFENAKTLLIILLAIVLCFFFVQNHRTETSININSIFSTFIVSEQCKPYFDEAVERFSMKEGKHFIYKKLLGSVRRRSGYDGVAMLLVGQHQSLERETTIMNYIYDSFLDCELTMTVEFSNSIEGWNEFRVFVKELEEKNIKAFEVKVSEDDLTVMLNGNDFFD